MRTMAMELTRWHKVAERLARDYGESVSESRTTLTHTTVSAYLGEEQEQEQFIQTQTQNALANLERAFRVQDAVAQIRQMVGDANVREWVSANPRYIDWVGHGKPQATWAFDGFGHVRDGQCEVPGTLQFLQCFVTTTDLVASTRIEKIEMLTQRPGQRGSIFVVIAGKLTAYDFDPFRLRQGSLDLVLLVHPGRINRML